MQEKKQARRSSEAILEDLQQASSVMVDAVHRKAKLGLEMAQVLVTQISKLPKEIDTGGFKPGVMDAADANMARATAILTRAVAHIAQCIGNERIRFVLSLSEYEDASVYDFADGQDCGYAQLAERLVAEREPVLAAREARTVREIEEQGEAWWNQDDPHEEADGDADMAWIMRTGTWGKY